MQSYDLGVTSEGNSKPHPSFADRLLQASATYAQFVFGSMLAGLLCMAVYAISLHASGAAQWLLPLSLALNLILGFAAGWYFRRSSVDERLANRLAKIERELANRRDRDQWHGVAE
jgi:hypothetical protein